MSPLLTASLIVKNESAFLPGCLESLAGIADEVVIVDTGSTDDSVQIARRWGARVVENEWTDDFSAARNASLDLATGDWILYIDADERLTGTTRTEVEGLLADADEVAFRILLRPSVGATPYREYRLWRNDPRIRFTGVIHEKVVPAIHSVAEADGRNIGLADFLLEHLGYEGDQTWKHHRNLPLLRRQLEIEPTNLFAWHHLARVLIGLGDLTGAEAALVTAIETARSFGRPDTLASLSYGTLIRLRNLQGIDVTELIDEALALYPDNCVLLWEKAWQLRERGEYEKALEPLDDILNVDWVTQRDEGPAYNRELVGEWPWDAKALCLFRLGRFDEAADAYTAAASCTPHNQTYLIKARLSSERANRTLASSCR